MNRYFLGLLLVALLCAVAYAQDVKVAEFACKDGWCVVAEKQAEAIIHAFNWLQQEVLRLRATTGCT